MMAAMSADAVTIGEFLHPDEWDFRGLNPEHFRVAERYELARESPDLQEALVLLTAERRKEIADLTEADWDWDGTLWAAREGCWLPKESFLLLRFILLCCWYCKDFPKPWMGLSEAQWTTAAKRCGEGQRCGERLLPLRILTRKQLDRIEQIEKKLSELQIPLPMGEQSRYIVEIDWEHGDDAQLKPLLLRLLDFRPRGIRASKRYTGKRAALGAHRFRQLAAWRLATKAHLNFKDASRLVHQRKKERPCDDPLTLLPSYASAGAWKDAVDAGAGLVRGGW
jgi:hypothetical protein